MCLFDNKRWGLWRYIGYDHFGFNKRTTMIFIKVNNSYSKITGFSDDQFKKIRNLLSYKTNQAASYFTGVYPKIRHCINSRGEFGTGLLEKLINFLKYNNIEFKINDERSKPKSTKEILLSSTCCKPYEFQVFAEKAAIKMNRGIISATTGSGKSLIMALIASRLGVKTLVVVPNLGLKKQLIDSFKCNLQDSSMITVENIDSTSLHRHRDFDCLILDEAHHVAAKTYQKLNKSTWNSIFYRFFLTATPFRNNSEETMLFESIAGSIIYEFNYKDAIKNNIVVPVESYYYEIPKVKTSAYTWAQVYSELIVNNEYRNYIVCSVLSQLNKNNKSTLCLVKEIEHGKILSQVSGIPFVSGVDPNSKILIDQFNEGKVLSLIGTTGIIGEGIDTKPAEYIIIAGLGKAKSAFMQNIGRGVRKHKNKESCKIILFKDKSHKFTSRHFKEQCVILKEEYSVESIKLEI